MATSLDLTKTYTSYSGVDIKVVVNGKQMGSMQAVSYAIQREKAPIYVMGKVDPISFSRGKRGIAGTMISLLLDQHFLYTDSFAGATAVLDADELIAVGAQADNGKAQTSTGRIVGVGAPSPTVDLNNFNANAGQINRLQASPDFTSLATGWKAAPVAYVDQILPFDVNIVAVNEYGQAAQMRLYGCEILNEGSGFSIDDIVVENQMTYVCRTILPWRAMQAPGEWADLKSNQSTTRGSTTLG
jgi:hypothetical protein